MLAQMGNVAAWQLRSIQSSECSVKQVEGKTGIPSILYKYIPISRIGQGSAEELAGDAAIGPQRCDGVQHRANGRWRCRRQPLSRCGGCKVARVLGNHHVKR